MSEGKHRSRAVSPTVAGEVVRCGATVFRARFDANPRAGFCREVILDFGKVSIGLVVEEKLELRHVGRKLCLGGAAAISSLDEFPDVSAGVLAGDDAPFSTGQGGFAAGDRGLDLVPVLFDEGVNFGIRQVRTDKRLKLVISLQVLQGGLELCDPFTFAGGCHIP